MSVSSTCSTSALPPVWFAYSDADCAPLIRRLVQSVLILIYVLAFLSCAPSSFAFITVFVSNGAISYKTVGFWEKILGYLQNSACSMAASILLAFRPHGDITEMSLNIYTLCTGRPNKFGDANYRTKSHQWDYELGTRRGFKLKTQWGHHFVSSAHSLGYELST